jgi:hypothetical protein
VRARGRDFGGDGWRSCDMMRGRKTRGLAGGISGDDGWRVCGMMRGRKTRARARMLVDALAPPLVVEIRENYSSNVILFATSEGSPF